MQNKYDLVYKTTTTPFFPISLLGRLYSRNLGQLFSLNLTSKEPLIVVIYDGVVSWFFPKSLSKIGEKVVAKLLSSPKYLRKMKAREKEISKKLLGELKLPPSNLFKDRALNKKGEEKL